jgi:hypothetical protein
MLFGIPDRSWVQAFSAARTRAEARYRYEQSQEAKRRERWGERPYRNDFSGQLPANILLCQVHCLKVG